MRSVCNAGHYLSHPVFSVLGHAFGQLVFIHIFLSAIRTLGSYLFGRRLLRPT